LGDGFLASFDGLVRAVRCASAISDAVRPIGIAVRSGLHTGEIELTGDDVSGVAVHIAARVAAKADASETIVSSTVRDLAAGSGLRFERRPGAPDRQRHARGPTRDTTTYSFGFPAGVLVGAAPLVVTFKPAGAGERCQYGNRDQPTARSWRAYDFNSVYPFAMASFR
jgi:hypothetical protein